MPIKLLIRSRLDSGPGPVERCFDQEAVTIGRSAKNDLSLHDPRRMVSSRHAEIRCRPPHCLVRDVGSKNGTVLNEERLAPGKEYPLRQGDRISIGDFMIDFDVLPSSPPVPADVEPARSRGVDDEIRVSDTVYRLKRRYAELSQEEPARRQRALVHVMQEALLGLDAQAAERVLRGVEARFHIAGQPQPAALKAPSFDAAPSLPGGASGTVHDACFALVRTYCKDLSPPLSDDFMKQLVERLDRILAVTIKGLAQAVEGRRQLTREFEMDVTKILAWTPNRIKLAESEQAIGAYLMDPRQSATESAVKDLEAVFEDLALHQMGLVAGLRACLRGILAELDPDAIEKTVKEERGKLSGLPWALGSEAWSRFRDKHRELSEEEVTLFERILAPHFASGYLSVQKAKKP